MNATVKLLRTAGTKSQSACRSQRVKTIDFIAFYGHDLVESQIHELLKMKAVVQKNMVKPGH